jgi:hypothetical protein
MARKSAKLKPQDHDGDIVWGARAIGEVINRSPRQTYHLLENKRLPARYDDGMYSASKRKLLAHVAGDKAE